MSNVVTIVQKEKEIYAEMTLNWDQTCIRLVPSLAWTMEKQGPRQVKIVGVKNKQQIAAVLYNNVHNRLLLLQVIHV